MGDPRAIGATKDGEKALVWNPVSWGAYFGNLDKALSATAQYLMRVSPETVTLRECRDLAEQIATLLSASREEAA